MRVSYSYAEFSSALDVVTDRPPIEQSKLVAAVDGFKLKLPEAHAPRIRRRAVSLYSRREALRARLAAYEGCDRYFYWTEELWSPLCHLGVMEARRMSADLHRIGYHSDIPALDTRLGDLMAYCDVTRVIRQLDEADRATIAYFFMPPLQLPSSIRFSPGPQPGLPDLLSVVRRLRKGINGEPDT